MKSLYSLIILLSLFACGQQEKKVSQHNDTFPAAPYHPKEVSSLPAPEQEDSLPKKPAVNPYANVAIDVKTFQNKEGAGKGTWGYAIYIDHSPNPTISQPSIPAMPGNNGFSTEAKSRKAGEFVAYKIKHNMMPPALTPAELDSLGVLH